MWHPPRLSLTASFAVAFVMTRKTSSWLLFPPSDRQENPYPRPESEVVIQGFLKKALTQMPHQLRIADHSISPPAWWESPSRSDLSWQNSAPPSSQEFTKASNILSRTVNSQAAQSTDDPAPAFTGQHWSLDVTRSRCSSEGTQKLSEPRGRLVCVSRGSGGSDDTVIRTISLNSNGGTSNEVVGYCSLETLGQDSIDKGDVDAQDIHAPFISRENSCISPVSFKHSTSTFTGTPLKSVPRSTRAKRSSTATSSNAVPWESHRWRPISCPIYSPIKLSTSQANLRRLPPSSLNAGGANRTCRRMSDCFEFDIKTQVYVSSFSQKEGSVLVQHNVVLSASITLLHRLTEAFKLHFVVRNAPWPQAVLNSAAEDGVVALPSIEASGRNRHTPLLLAVTVSKLDLEIPLIFNATIEHTLSPGGVQILPLLFQPCTGHILCESILVQEPLLPLTLCPSNENLGWVRSYNPQTGHHWIYQGNKAMEQVCTGRHGVADLIIKELSHLELPRPQVHNESLLAWSMEVSVDTVFQTAVSCHMKLKIMIGCSQILLAVDPAHWHLASYTIGKSGQLDNDAMWIIAEDGTYHLMEQPYRIQQSCLALEIYWEIPWSDVEAFHLESEGICLPSILSHDVLGGRLHCSIAAVQLTLQCPPEERSTRISANPVIALPALNSGTRIVLNISESARCSPGRRTWTAPAGPHIRGKSPSSTRTCLESDQESNRHVRSNTHSRSSSSSDGYRSEKLGVPSRYSSIIGWFLLCFFLFLILLFILDLPSTGPRYALIRSTMIADAPDNDSMARGASAVSTYEMPETIAASEESAHESSRGLEPSLLAGLRDRIDDSLGWAWLAQ